MNAEQTPYKFITNEDPIITVSKLTLKQDRYRHIYENLADIFEEAEDYEEFHEVIEAFNTKTKNPVEFVMSDGDYKVCYDAVSKM